MTDDRRDSGFGDIVVQQGRYERVAERMENFCMLLHDAAPIFEPSKPS